MRVLHLTDDLAGLSGVRSYLGRLGDALLPEGVECEIACPPPRPEVANHLARWASPGDHRRLARRLAERPPDVVHAHNLWMRLSPLPLHAARAAGVPVVMTVHDYHLVCPRKWMITPDGRPCTTAFGARCLVLDCEASRKGLPWLPYNQLRWLKAALHRRMLRAWVDLFVSPSGHLAGWLGRSLDLPQVEVVPNFAPSPADDEREGGADTGTLLYAGRLGREKGVEVLLRALAAVRPERPQVSLVIAGDGPERTKLGDLVRRLGLSGSVTFTGALDPGSLSARYREAAVCILPTLWMENCPVAVLEAMAHGRPVIATRIGGIPELVEDGVTGLLVPRAEVGPLAEAILSLVDDPGRAAAMGAAARATHRRRFSAERHASRLARIYREVRSGGGP